MSDTNKKTVMTKKRIAAYRKNFKKRLELPSAKWPNSKPVKYEGVSRSIREWASVRGCSYTAMRNRLAKYPAEIALSPEFSYELAMKIYTGEIKVRKTRKATRKA